MARDIVRKIQEERKKLQTKPNDKIKVTIPFWPREHEEYIKKKALIRKLTKGEKPEGWGVVVVPAEEDSETPAK